MKTAQENFWAGEFGDDYTARNDGAAFLASKTANFAKILSRLSVFTQGGLELGTNIGLNVITLKRLFSQLQIDVVEINQKAASECRNVHVFQNSILDFSINKTYDITFTSGVLNVILLASTCIKIYSWWIMGLFIIEMQISPQMTPTGF